MTIPHGLGGRGDFTFVWFLGQYKGDDGPDRKVQKSKKKKKINKYSNNFKNNFKL